MNPVDEFRSNFFNNLVKEEKQKECAQKIAQRNCFHKYRPVDKMVNGFQEVSCSKCGHTTNKLIKLAASHDKGCIIS